MGLHEKARPAVGRSSSTETTQRQEEEQQPHAQNQHTEAPGSAQPEAEPSTQLCPQEACRDGEKAVQPVGQLNQRAQPRAQAARRGTEPSGFTSLVSRILKHH